MADETIGIANIFDAILQFIPYSIACLYYILVSATTACFQVLDILLWHPVVGLWNTFVDFYTFLYTFYELVFSGWGIDGFLLVTCFFIDFGIIVVFFLMRAWKFVKDLIPFL